LVLEREPENARENMTKKINKDQNTCKTDKNATLKYDEMTCHLPDSDGNPQGSQVEL